MIAHPSIGTRLDKYVLRRLLAQGGMGDIYEAVNSETGETVAIKVLRIGRATDAKSLGRFAEEIRTSTRLSHPNIVRVLGAGFSDVGPFLAMELLRGRTLEIELSLSGERLPLGVALEWLLPVMGAVATAHRAGVLHRDLKPANLFLHKRNDGARVPKLLDFGIAKVLEAHALTHSGTVIGTPQYMSPEQAADEALTPASDVWSMGVILYRSVSGRLPFVASNPTALLHKLVTDRAPAIGTVYPDVPPRMAAAIDKALERSPDARYASMEEFAQALLWTAVAESVDLPEDPDPLGLPNWRHWVETASVDTGTARALPAPRTLSETPSPVVRVDDRFDTARDVAPASRSSSSSAVASRQSVWRARVAAAVLLAAWAGLVAVAGGLGTPRTLRSEPLQRAQALVSRVPASGRPEGGTKKGEQATGPAAKRAREVPNVSRSVQASAEQGASPKDLPRNAVRPTSGLGAGERELGRTRRGRAVPNLPHPGGTATPLDTVRSTEPARDAEPASSVGLPWPQPRTDW